MSLNFFKIAEGFADISKLSLRLKELTDIMKEYEKKNGNKKSLNYR